MDFAGRQWS